MSLQRVALDDLDDEPHAHPFGSDEPTVVRLSLAAGESVPEHSHPGRTVVCNGLEGELTLRLDGDGHDLAAGDLVRFSGDRDVSPVARTDCEALLVLAET